MTNRGGKERLNGADLEMHCFTTHTHTHTHTPLDPYVPCCHGNAVDGFPACSAGISIFEHSLPHNCISCKTHTFHCVSHFVILTRSNPAPSFNSRSNNKDGAWGRCKGTERSRTSKEQCCLVTSSYVCWSRTCVLMPCTHTYLLCVIHQRFVHSNDLNTVWDL